MELINSITGTIQNIVKSIDILSLVIGAILGAIPSWFFTHIYYKKSKKDSEITIQELKEDNRKTREEIKKHNETLIGQVEDIMPFYKEDEEWELDEDYE